jgi:hypothetical protein
MTAAARKSVISVSVLTGLILFGLQLLVTRHLLNLDEIRAHRMQITTEIATIVLDLKYLKTELEQIKILVGDTRMKLHVQDVRHERTIARLQAIETALRLQQAQDVGEIP